MMPDSSFPSTKGREEDIYESGKAGKFAGKFAVGLALSDIPLGMWHMQPFNHL